jgi:flagellar protein FlaF
MHQGQSMKNPEFRTTAYFDLAAPTKSARSAEYQAFARVTRALQLADTNDPARFADLALALHENLRLWNVIAADVARPANALPADLKARLFSLAEYTRAHQRRILSGEGRATVLIEINTAVMRGLRAGQGAEQSAEAVA